METRSRSNASKTPNPASATADDTHDDAHVETPAMERPQALALPVNASHAVTPHAHASHGDPTNDSLPRAAEPSAGFGGDHVARLKAMITAAINKSFTLTCER